MESKNLIIRCSSLGAIMTNARAKNTKLSKTCKTHIEELFNENEFNISNKWTNKFVEKGIDVEDSSLMLAQKNHNWDFVTKNEERFTNDFITGEPDAILGNFVIEIKSSWGLKTFPMFEDVNPNKNYEYQVQGYLWLTGKEVGFLSYCLIDTPEEIVNDELFRASRSMGHILLPEEVEQEIRSNHSFGHIPEKLRTKTFKIERDEETIGKIKERVLDCREYYQELKNKLKIK